MFWSQNSVLSVEDLNCGTYNKKGALAKAIVSMPDSEDLYTRAVAVVHWITNNPVVLVKVDPHFTSQGQHLGCSEVPKGKPVRSKGRYDIAPCSDCGIGINTHELAAIHILKRGLEYIENKAKIGNIMKLSPLSAYSSGF